VLKIVYKFFLKKNSLNLIKVKQEKNSNVVLSDMINFFNKIPSAQDAN
jgi:hypothetical protein